MLLGFGFLNGAAPQNDPITGALVAAATLVSVVVTGVGVRLLLAARAADAPIVPPAVLVLGGVAAAAVGLALTPFALAGNLPSGLGAFAFLFIAVVLVGSLGAWALLRRVP